MTGRDFKENYKSIYKNLENTYQSMKENRKMSTHYLIVLLC